MPRSKADAIKMAQREANRLNKPQVIYKVDDDMGYSFASEDWATACNEGPIEAVVQPQK